MNILHNFYSATDDQEIQKLEKISLYIFILLTLIIITCSLLLTCTIGSDWKATSAAFAGIVGSATASLLSALSRRANGWELSNGEKYPKSENDNSSEKTRKERFSLSMAPFFCFRPFLGIISGLIVYYGGDFLGLKIEDSTNDKLLTPEELQLLKEEAFRVVIFFSLLSGLFAKTLIEILKGMFKSFFGRG